MCLWGPELEWVHGVTRFPQCIVKRKLGVLLDTPFMTRAGVKRLLLYSSFQ